MENCKTTDEPDSYEAVDYEKIWRDIMWYSLQKIAILFKNADQRKHKDMYAQDGWCWNEHEEEPIVTLQPDQHLDVLLVSKEEGMMKQ